MDMLDRRGLVEDGVRSYTAWKVFARDLLAWRSLDIRRGDVVLDLGGGAEPCPRADILCGRVRLDGAGLPVGPPPDRPLVVGDCLRLPFADKSIDYILCRGLVEHLPDPEPLLREVMRVGRRGLIEAPSVLREKVRPGSDHRWFVSIDGGVLTLRRKQGVIFDRTIADFAYRHSNDDVFRTFMHRYHDEMTCTFEWDGVFDYEVVRGREDARWEDLLRAGEWAPGGASPWRRLRAAAGRAVRAVSCGHDVDLGRVAACPACRGPLDWVANAAVCPACSVAYPVRAGLPVLLVEEGRPAARAEERPFIAAASAPAARAEERPFIAAAAVVASQPLPAPNAA